MLLAGSPSHVFSVVESELDAILIHQEAGDLVGVVAMGSAQAKPDRETHEHLARSSRILLCLDADEAGARAARRFWRPTYGDGKVRRWPVPLGKDPGEALGKGLSVRAWIEAGLQ
jgi:DNA primase